VMVLKFHEFLLENKRAKKHKIKKPKKKKIKPTEFAKELKRRQKQWSKKWVCLIVTNRTRNDYNLKNPGQPYDPQNLIRFGSHRILLNSEKQLEKAKLKYQVGNIFNGVETIEQVHFHDFNPLIDSQLLAEQK